MPTPLNAEIPIFHFYSLNIYNTSNTVDKKSTKAPNQLPPVVTVVTVVFQAGGHRPFLPESQHKK